MRKILDYYDILGVNKDATDEEIKNAFRNLAKEWHPDTKKHKHREATKKFAEISTAYEVLSNPQKRKKYDLYYGYSFQRSEPYRNTYNDFGFDKEWEEMSRWFQNIYEDNLKRAQKSVDVLLRRIKRGFIGAVIGLIIGIPFRLALIPLMIMGWCFGYYLIRDKK
jgi:DnaJ-class molecular chaperone